VARLQTAQLAQRRGPQDAVGREADVALEFHERLRRRVAEDAVDPTGVEAERAEMLLKLGHVVAAQHGRAPVQEAVADVVAGFDEHVPGLAPADAVDAQTPAVLEGFDVHPGGRPEDADGVGAVEAQRPEAQLQLADGRPAGPLDDRQDTVDGYRYAESSWSS
jgi:hypothetical protein